MSEYINNAEKDELLVMVQRLQETGIRIPAISKLTGIKKDKLVRLTVGRSVIFNRSDLIKIIKMYTLLEINNNY